MRREEVERQSDELCNCNLGKGNQRNNRADSQRKHSHRRRQLLRYGFYKREEVSERKMWKVFSCYIY